MKKTLRAVLLVAFVLLFVWLLPQQAQAASESDLTFTLNSDGESYSVSDCNTSAQGTLQIPATYQGKPITKIGRRAFWGCSNLTEITIPTRVTSIGVSAFAYCSSLTSVKIPNSVTTIGLYAFSDCSSLTSVTIPASVTSIGDSAFGYCSSLTGIWVDENNHKYSNDSAGVLLNKDQTVLIRAPGALSGEYYVPGSVTRIGNSAFCDCNNLTSITIPASVTNIGNSAFWGCRSLTEITIPASVTDIGHSAFDVCSNLTGIWVDGNNPNYSSDSAGVLLNKDQTVLIRAPGALSGEYYVPGSVTVIGSSAFSICESLTSVTIPDGVTDFYEHAFSDCSSLTNINIPDGVTSIGYGVFWGCSSLTSVKIPNSVTTIGFLAFSDCSSLTKINIPESVTSIDEFAFEGCSRLTDVYYGGTEEQWTQINIYEGNESLTNATIHHNTRSVSDVSVGSWQYAHVQYALQRNLMAGKGTDAHGRIQFDPNSPITREEFVQVLYNAEGKPAVDLLNPFPDVAENGWYKNAVLWAKKNDIANGGGDGNFGIGARIIRQDLALMLYKYAALKGCSLGAQEGITDQFGDKDSISGYAKTAMDWAVTNGILSGKGAAGQPLSTFRLDPTGTATRAECAAMLRNFMTAFGL